MRRVATSSSGKRITLIVPVADTLSCYDPVTQDDMPAGPPAHCGRCDACLLRKKGFRDARIADPTVYA